MAPNAPSALPASTDDDLTHAPQLGGRLCLRSIAAISLHCGLDDLAAGHGHFEPVGSAPTLMKQLDHEGGSWRSSSLYRTRTDARSKSSSTTTAIGSEEHLMSRLFEPLLIGDLRLENRIVIAPMCQYSATNGSAGDWHMIHLGHLALSGAGLLILEATAVSPEGRITPQDLGLYSDADEAALARVLKAVRAHSPIPVAMQLSHAGRKASSRAPWEGGAQIRPDELLGWKTEAPSPVPHSP